MQHASTWCSYVYSEQQCIWGLGRSERHTCWLSGTSTSDDASEGGQQGGGLQQAV